MFNSQIIPPDLVSEHECVSVAMYEEESGRVVAPGRPGGCGSTDSHPAVG